MNVKYPPFRLRIDGDNAVAKRFVGRATQLYRDLINRLDINTDVKTKYERYPLDPDGKIKGVIEIYRSIGVSTVTIHVTKPEIEEVELIAKPRWEPWNGNKADICLSHTWEIGMFTTQTDGAGRAGWGGGSAQAGNPFPGAQPAEFNWVLCDATTTWVPAYPELADNYYWIDIVADTEEANGGALFLNCYGLPGYRISPGYWSWYVTWYVLWFKVYDTIAPDTNEGAEKLELKCRAWVDADTGAGLGDGNPLFFSYAAFIATDEFNNYFVWFLVIDEWYYNIQHGFDPTHTAFIGDGGFSVGCTGKPIILDLADYGFTGKIIKCGFVVDGVYKGKGAAGGGRDTNVLCDYIDFY